MTQSIRDQLATLDRERRACNGEFLAKAKLLRAQLAGASESSPEPEIVEALQPSTERPTLAEFVAAGYEAADYEMFFGVPPAPPAPVVSDVVGSHNVVRAQTLIFESGHENRPSKTATSEDSEKA